MTTLPNTVQERLALPGPAPTSAPTPGELLGIIRRRIVLITILFIFLAGAAGGGFYAWWRYFPKYRATALVEMVSNRPHTELSVELRNLPEREQERFMLTQSFVVKSPTVLSAALQDEDIQRTSWYKDLPVYRNPLLVLTDELVSAPMRGTNFLSVSIATRSPKDPDVIVNTIVTKYINTVLAQAAEPYEKDLRDANASLKVLDDTLVQKRADLLALSETIQGGGVPAGWSTISQQGAMYAQQAAELQMQLAQVIPLRNFYADGSALTAEDVAAAEADPYVAQLSAGVFSLTQQRDVLLQRLGPKHAGIRQFDDAIRIAQQRLNEARSDALRQRRELMIDAVETAHANLTAALTSATENLLQTESEQKENNRRLFTFQLQQIELARLEQNRQELRDYIDELKRLTAANTAMTIRVQQPATEPLGRAEPSLLMLPVLLALALMLSVGIGVGLDLLDTSVRTTQDIVRYVQVPLLGVVPDADDEEVRLDHVELALLTAPQSMTAEAFRQIRANLQYSAPAARQRSIVVTSPGPGDGKTTVACNLAIAAAQAGRRVLLVDANLRRPCLGEHWAGVEDRGLTTLLIGEGALTDLAVKTPIPNLHVLGSGPMTPNPAELLAGDAFQAFLAGAVQKYDQVILDAPPVLLASDPTVLSSQVDGVIMTVRAKTNSRGAARRACALLASVNAHIFGAVLNAAQVTRGGYFREQLRTYYDYQPPQLGRGKS
ncbi:MAG: polysaccharide biosynthesis tyrosine autokinase [Phycisphaerae bacterium]|nr:MAG: polysaccharide biosynthesis tyrosine autokinase [Planctomycetota bacterium]KAB2947676.1 MAG: polysaccharide biosynthesis tyrosine autokinase [Phycisphaerae bacterium]MBE7455953.1 polysaccharide biosynthesis tyrosine autokinase [Planctomycetia bacterium]MCK6464676.1 polysaccharide biosynthesis tyrosine autokinase [Phycisphaerae bacterium]MCL4717211.1 polysaccharide biosynthesis tyrosine autokinase [Phycisphaerae bacterium]